MACILVCFLMLIIFNLETFIYGAAIYTVHLEQRKLDHLHPLSKKGHHQEKAAHHLPHPRKRHLLGTSLQRICSFYIISARTALMLVHISMPLELVIILSPTE